MRQPIPNSIRDNASVRSGWRRGLRQRFGQFCLFSLILGVGTLHASSSLTVVTGGSAYAGANAAGGTVTISNFPVPSTGLPAGDTYLIVGISCHAGCNVTSISWNGGPFTNWASLGTKADAGNTTMYIYQLQNPAAATASIVVTTSADKVVAGAFLLGGVHTGGAGSAFRAFASNVATSGTATVTGIATNPGDMIIDVLAPHNDGTCCDAPASGQTAEWTVTNGAGTTSAGDGGVRAITSGTTATESWTLKASTDYAMGCISVIPQTASTPTIQRTGQTIIGTLLPPGEGQPGVGSP
jgi:hypothetical protein